MIKNVISVKSYDAQNQLYARHQNKMLESLICEELIFSRVRKVCGIDPIHGIHAVMELGYFDPNFILAGSETLVYLVTSFICSFSYSLLSQCRLSSAEFLL